MYQALLRGLYMSKKFEYLVESLDDLVDTIKYNDFDNKYSDLINKVSKDVDIDLFNELLNKTMEYWYKLGKYVGMIESL